MNSTLSVGTDPTRKKHPDKRLSVSYEYRHCEFDYVVEVYAFTLAAITTEYQVRTIERRDAATGSPAVSVEPRVVGSRVGYP